MSDDEDDDLDDDLPPLDLSKDKVCDPSGTYCWTACPHCRTKNWMYLGRMDDCTVADVQSLRCFQCKKLSWLDHDTRDLAADDRTKLSDSYYVDGTQTPD